MIRTTIAIGAVCAAAVVPATAEWSYSNEVDQMRGATISYATVTSGDLLDFSFPYQGGARVVLGFRLRDQSSLEAYLMIDKGQFTCSGYSRGIVSVKFDQKAVEEFRCNQAAGGNTKTIFINDAAGLLRRMRGASRLIIEAEFFQEGNRQFTFDVADLRWSLN